MPENSDLTPQYQDDALASFVDRLLNGEAIDPAKEAATDNELQALEAMALRFSKVATPTTPDPAMAKRIHSNLAAEFQSTMKPAAVPVAQRTLSWWDKLRELGSELTANRSAGRYRSKSRQRGYSFALAGATLVALIFLAIFVPLPGSGQSVGATLADNPALAVVSLVVGLALITGALWLIRRKR